MSSGAAMAVALKEAQQMKAGTVVVVLPDGGERYLSTSLFTVKQDIGLKLFNTLNKRKEPFEPVIPGSVSLYSYGPTAHARMHIGEMRRYVFADQLCRYLRYRGYRVKHVMNIADLDDKTIRESEKAGLELLAVLHTHPGGQFVSGTDRVYIMNASRFTTLVWVIVGINEGIIELGAYMVLGGEIIEIPIDFHELRKTF